MIRISIRDVLWLTVVVAVAGSVANGDDEDPAAAFRGLKASLQQKLHHSNREIRLAAISQIASYITPDAAKVLLYQGVGNGDIATRRAALKG